VPTYQYVCTDCGEPLEVVQSFSDPSLTTCPACEGRLRKVFSAVGVVFKGSGFYRTDSRAGSSGSGGAGKDGSGGAGKDGSGGPGKDGGKPAKEAVPAAAGSSSSSGSGSGPSGGSSGSSSSSGTSGGSSTAGGSTS
jgi:putative FmdB family regulatory protein